MAWEQLITMIEEGRKLDREQAVKVPVECPNDFTTLLEGPDGSRYCPWDGWNSRVDG